MKHLYVKLSIMVFLLGQIFPVSQVRFSLEGFHVVCEWREEGRSTLLFAIVTFWHAAKVFCETFLHGYMYHFNKQKLQWLPWVVPGFLLLFTGLVSWGLKCCSLAKLFGFNIRVSGWNLMVCYEQEIRLDDVIILSGLQLSETIYSKEGPMGAWAKAKDCIWLVTMT